MHGVASPQTEPFTHPDYEVERLLGSGGQAQVFLAHHRTLGRKVAIKVLRNNQDESMVRRILQEGRLIANLRHPNLVQVFDAGQTAEGRPYIVMEYIDGLQLNRWRANQRLTINDALQLTWQVASGLAAAHEAGIIHRDVKPLNIVVETHSGATGASFCAKLLDFGVARPSGSDETAVGMVIGTVGFMAPEVYDGNPTSASDVFSLGVILHWLLSGQKGVRATEIRRRLTEGHTGEPWCQHPEMVELVLGMVASSAADRPQSAVELTQQLEELRPWTRFDRSPASSSETVVVPARRRSSPALGPALIGGSIAIFLGAAGLLVGLHYASNRSKPATTLTPAPPATALSTANKPGAAPPTPVPTRAPPTSADAASTPGPPTATLPPPKPAAATGPEPARTVSPPATGSPAPSPPPEDAPAPPEDAPAAESAPAPPAPESTPPTQTLAVGRYPGTIQGRAIEIEISGTASALRARLSLQVGARTETHTMTGTATLKGNAWHIAAAEPGGKWTLQGTLSGEHLQASVAIKGKSRGSIDARRTP